MKRLLIVYTSQTGRSARLAHAAAEGARDSGDADVQLLRADAAGIDELLAAHGLILVTPENFGYMAGLMKDFLDRTYYPAEGKTVGLPYALLVSAGNDGSGAVRAIERIAIGYGWKPVAEALICKGEPDEAALRACRELGAALAAGLAAGVF